jgi:hypothetical protein
MSVCDGTGSLRGGSGRSRRGRGPRRRSPSGSGTARRCRSRTRRAGSPRRSSPGTPSPPRRRAWRSCRSIRSAPRRARERRSGRTGLGELHVDARLPAGTRGRIVQTMPRAVTHCPNCGQTVTPFAAGCAVCGTDLEAARARRGAPSAGSSSPRPLVRPASRPERSIGSISRSRCWWRSRSAGRAPARAVLGLPAPPRRRAGDDGG